MFGQDAFTPEEARTTALVVARWLRKHRFKVELESGLDAAPLRTTLLGVSSDLKYLVEAQGSPSLSSALEGLAVWLSVERAYAQLYVAVSATDDSVLSGRMLAQMKRHGIGLLLVTDEVDVAFEARNPALVVTPEPTLKFGSCASDVRIAVDRFNRGERKAGLRDMCELVERETNALARKLARKQWIDRDENTIGGFDFANTINVIASSTRYLGTRAPLVSDKLKDDLHSFRGARNLVDHPVKTKYAEVKRERQFPERMMMGPRLVAELVALQRTVR
jgi:hypothetical protein